MRVSEWVLREQAKHPECEFCGTEIVVKPHHHYYGISRFCRGHNSKMEQHKKLVEQNFNEWRKESPEEAHRTYVRGGRLAGQKQAQWVREHPLESHRNAVEKGKKSAELGKSIEALRRFEREQPEKALAVRVRNGQKVGKWSVETGQIVRAREACRLAHPTSIELELGEELDQRGVTSEPEKRIGWCRVDRFLPRLNIVVFADGCWWHGCPGCYPDGGHKGKKDYQRETKYLESLGYKVFRFWECEIHRNVVACVNRVLGDL